MRTADALASGATEPAALVAPFHNAFATAATVGAMAIVASLALIRRHHFEQQGERVEPRELALELAA